MWGWFGANAKKDDKDSAKKAILELREHIQLLNKKQNFLITQMDTYKGQAKIYLQQNKKEMAKNYLKKGKILDSQVLKISNQVDSMEQQLFSIESANLNLETMKAMKNGANAMKNIHKGLDIDKVDDTMDEIREQVELGDEISDAISRPLNSGVANAVDEDELEEELNALMEEQATEDMVGVTPQKQQQSAVASTNNNNNNNNNIKNKMEMPNAPVSNLVSDNKHVQAEQEEEEEEEEDEDERALRELQAEMGL